MKPVGHRIVFVVLVVLIILQSNNVRGAISTGTEMLNVQDFGASGNGISDNTDAILRAASNLKKGMALFFPRGKYLIKSKLTFTKGISITGASGASIVGSCQIFFKPSCDSVTITRLQFYGVSLLVNCSNVLIRSCNFMQIENNAIGVFGDEISTVHNISITNNRFSSIFPSSSKTYNSSGRAVYLNTRGLMSNINLDSNSCVNTYGGSVFFLMGNINNFSISRNVIDKTSGQGIELYKIKPENRGIIKKNTIKYCGVLRKGMFHSGVGCNGIYGISQGDALMNVTVDSNFIADVYENGIEGEFGVVSNNEIRNTGKDLKNFFTPSPEGIFGGFNIENNLIINPGGHGIYIFKDKGDFLGNRRIVGNTIRRSDITLLYNAIQINMKSNSGITQDVIVKGNIAENFKSFIFLSHNGNFKDVIIENNETKSCRSFIENTNRKGISARLNKVIN